MLCNTKDHQRDSCVTCRDVLAILSAADLATKATPMHFECPVIAADKGPSPGVALYV